MMYKLSGSVGNMWDKNFNALIRINNTIYHLSFYRAPDPIEHTQKVINGEAPPEWVVWRVPDKETIKIKDIHG